MAQTVTVGVTGGEGMLGTHVRAYLHTLPNVIVRSANRATFEQRQLEEFVLGCDAVIHLAGMNRGDESEVARTNVSITRDLIHALQRCGSQAHVLFSSSTHVERETLYGQSKREAAQLLQAWSEESGGLFTNVIMPGIFGEGGRANYNSVVATFCHQLIVGEEPSVSPGAMTEQIHAQSVARQLWQMIVERPSDTVRINGMTLIVEKLLARLRLMHELYSQHIIPDLREPLDRDLFNTYRSFLFPHHYPVPLTLHIDPRGSLFEAVKSPSGGQTFMSTTSPGVTRGNHFHTRKMERFLVVSGEAEIKVRHLLQTEIQSFRVSGEQPSYIDIPTLHTHNITNVGAGPLLTLFWSHEFFDPMNPDQFNEMVELE